VTVKTFSSDKAPVLFACEVSGIILVKNLIYRLVEKVIICLNGGGYIILNDKEISREYSFSRGGSNTETNASPSINHPNCNRFGFFRPPRRLASPIQADGRRLFFPPFWWWSVGENPSKLFEF
jgi:hypothetical protein